MNQPDERAPGQPSDEPSAEDQALLDELRATLAAADPVPEVLVHAARQSLTWRTVDAELAELVADSALTGELVRGGGAPRVLTFTVPAVSLVVEVVRHGGLRRLLGQLVGGPVRGLRLQRPASEEAVAVDERGHFRLDSVPGGPARFAFEIDGRQSVTAWVTV
jgi:hypothetical protein